MVNIEKILVPIEAKIVEILTKNKIADEVVEHEPVYMDQDLAKREFVYFNPGKHDKSFKIRAWDLKRVCHPKMV